MEGSVARTIQRWSGSVSKEACSREEHPTKKTEGSGSDGEESAQGRDWGNPDYQIAA